MFGEYAQIASFLSPRDNYGAGSSYDEDPLPAYLRPPPLYPGLSFDSGRDRNGLKDDFIMIAEFSELEGPKPVMTIPKDGGENFDQNSFSVRLLATDYMTQNVGFSISEDAQVVLSEHESGVFAFVHHFVLYDNTARGFVRPYCIAFITTDQRKLMHCYGEMSSQMKKVARLFKYGNMLVFVADLERHLKDLDHTKGVLLARVSKMRLKDGSTDQEMRKNAENELHRALQAIHQSSSEIKDILTILRPLLCDKRLEDRFRLLEERAYHDASSSVLDKLSLQENWFNDLSSLQSIDPRGTGGSLKDSRGNSPLSLFRLREHTPVLVETKKANRFNAPLRGLHELCSWGAKEGLKKLRRVQEYFKRDMVTIELEKTESKLFRPGGTGVFCGQCVTGNFLHGLKRLPFPMFDDTENASLTDIDFTSMTSLDSLESYKSADDASLTHYRAVNPSPCSFQTVDSHNGQILTSIPASMNNINEISLGEESEYYPPSPELDKLLLANNETLTESQDEVTPTHDFDPMGQSQPSVPTSTLHEIGQRPIQTCARNSSQVLPLAVNDDDPPPLVVFQERIQRPLSVISLGCVNETTENLIDNEGECIEKALKTNVSSLISEKLDGEDGSHSEKGTIESTEFDYNLSSKSQLNSAMRLNSSATALDTSEGRPQNISNLSGSENSTNFYHKDVEGQCLCDKRTLLKIGDTGLNCEEKEIKDNLGNHFAQSRPIPIKSTRVASELPSDSAIGNSELSKSFEEDTSILVSAPVLSPSTPLPSTSSSNSSKISALFPSVAIQRSSPTKVVKKLSDSSCHTSEHSSWHDSVNDGHLRTTSNASSSFTELSMKDYSSLVGKESQPVPLVDFQSQRSLYEDDPSEFDCHDENTHLATGIWHPRNGLYTLGDWLNNLGTGKPGYGLLDIMNSYSNLQHVIFSLLSGRPVLVIGTPKMEPEVIKVVNALAAFVPSTKRKRHTVLEWTSKPLKISDLTKLRLVGVCRPERRNLDSCVPYAIKKASTLLDVDRKLISAPQYQGQLIHSLLAKKKCFKKEDLLLSHIQWWLMDLMSKAFIFFHSFCLGSAGSIFFAHGLREHREAYSKTVAGIMGRLGIRDNDCSIVEYMAELAKLSYLESSQQIAFESGNLVQPLHLRYTVCQTFRC